MRCASCQRDIADGSVICPHCEAVLDASAFEAPAPAKPKRPIAPRRAAAPPAPEPAKAAPRRRVRRKVEIDYSPDRVLGDAWQVIQSLLPFDRAALYGCAGMGVALFFPWRMSQTEGEEIGAFGGGWPVVLLLALAATALYLRTSDDLRGFRPDSLAIVQLLAAAASAAYCAWYFFAAVDNRPYRSISGVVNLKISSPEIGVVLCALCAVLLGASSAWAWLVERSS